MKKLDVLEMRKVEAGEPVPFPFVAELSGDVFSFTTLLGNEITISWKRTPWGMPFISFIGVNALPSGNYGFLAPFLAFSPVSFVADVYKWIMGELDFM